jgi:hypothetical protein
MTLPKTMPELLLQLLQELELIGVDHEEVYDTVCRDKMSDVIWNLFILPAKKYKYPDDFGLYSNSSNQEIKQALQTYIDGANKVKITSHSLILFQNRLAAFQDTEIETKNKNQFDDFFGWFNPEIKDRTWYLQYLLRELMQDLEVLAMENAEIYTSAFREKVSVVIWDGFILPNHNYKISDDFGLSSDNANQEVKQSLQIYLQEAGKIASSLSFKFHKRLTTFQDRNISTYPKRSHFDDFFKWHDPTGFDASGKWFGIQKSITTGQKKFEEEPIDLYAISEGQLSLFDE